MGFSLAPQAEAAGYGLVALDELDGSTNTVALERARAGAAAPFWVVTPHQKGGRGRRGRVWEAPRGNLAASVLIDVDCEPALAATLGFVTGLAVHRALASSAPNIDRGGRLTLKWPNDLLLDGGKLVGILLESEILPSGRRIVVAGMGVNLVASPEGTPYPVSSLASAGERLSAESLFETLSATWLESLAAWHNGLGMPEIRAQWLARAAGIGLPVAVSLGDETVTGIFETIDDAGQLVVQQQDGSRRPITAGDVHFGSAASAKGR